MQLKVSDFTTFHPLQGVVVKNELPISLSHKEVAILLTLCMHPNSPVSLANIVRAGWYHSDYVSPHQIHACINRIRNKLGEPEASQIISVSGYGYVMCLEP